MTLNTNDNEILTDLLKTGFKRSVFLNEYKTKIETHTADANNLKRILLDSSFQGVNRLFVLAYDNTENRANAIHMKSPRRYALSKVNLNKFNVLIDGRNFYDQPISDKITKCEELMILCTGKGKDYTTGWLLDYKYYKNHYSIIPATLSFQKELDFDPRLIQQVVVVFMLDTASQILTILEKSKETILEFSKGTAKVS